MNWIDHIRSRYTESGAIVTERFIEVDGCKVALRGFPIPNLVLCVDTLLKTDEFLIKLSAGKKRCDLIVFAGNANGIDIVLIEAKSGSKNRQKRIGEAIKQIISSKKILDNALRECAMESNLGARFGVAVTRSLQWSDAVAFKARSKAVKIGIELVHVPCDKDVWHIINP